LGSKLERSACEPSVTSCCLCHYVIGILYDTLFGLLNRAQFLFAAQDHVTIEMAIENINNQTNKHGLQFEKNEKSLQNSY